MSERIVTTCDRCASYLTLDEVMITPMGWIDADAEEATSKHGWTEIGPSKHLCPDCLEEDRAKKEMA